MLIVGLVGNGMFFFVPAISTSNIKKEKPKIKTMIKLFKVKELRPLMLFMSFSGIIIAFYSGFLFKLIENVIDKSGEESDPNESNQKTAAVFIVLGKIE